MDAQRVNLDGFAAPDPSLGLVAMASPYDPEPSLVIRDGRIVELDGTSEEQFDVIDEFIAHHGIDLTVADEAPGWAVTITADRCDEVGCLVWELNLRRASMAPARPVTLSDWAQAVATRVTGLLEPLKVRLAAVE